MTVELALAAGKAVGLWAGRLWLSDRTLAEERGKDLIELIQVRFPDRIVRRRVQRQLDDIADLVAERLITLCGHEYRGLSEGDKSAALAEVTVVLRRANFSDEALFAADVDPMKVARDVRARLTSRDMGAELGTAGAAFYDLLLEECCECLVRIIRQLPQFVPRASAETLSRLSSLADQVAMVLARLPIRSLDAPAGTADDVEFRRRYLGYVSTTLDYLELFGISFERYQPRTILSVAYISLSVSTDADAKRRFQSWAPYRQASLPDDWRERDFDPGTGTLRVEAALSRSRLMLIRGEAGSGKSTLLRWLTIAAARGNFTADLADWNGCVPFLIRLRDYTSGSLPRPEGFLDNFAGPVSGLMPVGWVHRQLHSGKALLLVDGVDELPNGQRREVRSWLGGIVSAYPQARVVITSRPAAAGSGWLESEGFASAFLERMSSADMRALVRHWHDAVRDRPDLPCPPERLPVCEAAMLARLESAPHLRALAASPLLAAMLCALNLDRDTQLPRDRMGLYAAALEMLIERRDAERYIPSFHEVRLEREQKIRILQDLAWRLSVTSRTELPVTAALRRVEEQLAMMPRVSASAAEVLDHLLQRSGVLREPVPGRVDFVHRTVQEYLTAKQAADDGDVEPLIANAHRDQWHETIVMAAGHANAPLRHELLAGLLDRIHNDPRYARRLKLLITACLETLPAVPIALNGEIQACMDDLIPPRDFSSARSLAASGEQLLTRLPHEVTGLSIGAARATVRTAWLINGPAALDVLASYAQDPRDQIQAEVIAGWKYFEPEEYAVRVLAAAPLQDGSLVVGGPGQLRAARHLRHLRYLRIFDWAVPDLSFLRDMASLEGIDVSELTGSDLSPLAIHAPTLTNLSILSPKDLDDLYTITALRRLKHLHFSAANIMDIGFIRELPPLSTLFIRGLGQIADFESVAAQKSLTNLGLWECEQLTNLDKLPPLTNIEWLAITHSHLTCGLDCVVAAAPDLKALRIGYSPWVSNLESIAELDLKELSVMGCNSVQDLEPLTGQRSLRFLNLEGTVIHDLTPLEHLTKLEILYLKDCPNVYDLSPLANLKKLSELHIEGVGPDIDLSPLADNHRLTLHIYEGQQVRNSSLLENGIRIKHERMIQDIR